MHRAALHLIPGQFFSTAALSPLFPSMITKHGRLSLSGHPKPANEGHLKTGQR